MSDGTSPDIAAAYAEMARGDFSAAPGLLAALQSQSTPEAHANLVAVQAHLWFADQPGGKLPDLTVLKSLVEVPAAQPAALRACILVQRAHLTGFELGPAGLAAQAMSDATPVDEASAIRRDFVQLVWKASHPHPGVEERLNALFHRARAQGLASLTIDIQCQLVLALLVRGALVEATVVARRASRMARTEGFPQQQYMANLLLARVRRLSGVPHLATHILRALSRVAPSPYGDWIRWERILAGTLPEPGDRPHGPHAAAHAVRALEAVFAAAITGHRGALRDSSDVLLEIAGRIPLIAREAQDLCIALDSQRRADGASDAMIAWLVGKAALPPHGLYGASREADDEPADRDVGYVSVEAGCPPRRVLGLSRPSDGVVHFDDGGQTDRRRTRVETGLAVLALASPEALEDRSFFREVYGFEFNPAVHPSVLDALLSRMRKSLGHVGSLHRDGGLLRLQFSRSAALPDPRCAQPVEDRILRVLVRAQDGSAKAAAARLGLPLRTIQEALKELTEDGACVKRREGRKIAYVVEDTTFAPPTRSGVRDK